MNMKKAMAALLALCLALGGLLGAVAEGEALNDLLGFYMRAIGNAEPAIEPGTDPVEAPEPEAPEADEPARDVGEIGDTGLSREWENILLLGTDSRTSDQDSRTDTMIVLSLNSETKDIRMTSLMRDIWVDIPGHGGAKLNAACVYGGPELTVQCINDYFGLDIHSYVLVNMQCLATIVDALGGIRMDVTDDEAAAINKLFADDRNANDENTYFVGEDVTAGSQVLLDGKQALAFARIRSLDSDYNRTDRQRQVLVTIAKQLQQQSLLNLAGIVAGMLKYVETNLGFDEIMAIAGVCMGVNLDAMQELRLPAEGTYQSGTYEGTWCIRPDFAENQRVLRAFIYGE